MAVFFCLLRKTSSTSWRGRAGTTDLEAELLPATNMLDPERPLLPDPETSDFRIRDSGRRTELILENTGDGAWKGRTTSALVAGGLPRDIPEGALLFVSVKIGSREDWDSEDALECLTHEDAKEIDRLATEGVLQEDGTCTLNELALEAVRARARAFLAFYEESVKRAEALELKLRGAHLGQSPEGRN